MVARNTNVDVVSLPKDFTRQTHHTKTWSNAEVFSIVYHGTFISLSGCTNRIDNLGIRWYGVSNYLKNKPLIYFSCAAASASADDSNTAITAMFARFALRSKRY